MKVTDTLKLLINKISLIAEAKMPAGRQAAGWENILWNSPLERSRR
jgi:hypothetical protein